MATVAGDTHTPFDVQKSEKRRGSMTIQYPTPKYRNGALIYNLQCNYNVHVHVHMYSTDHS